jgi:hypothetical protein
MSLVLSTHGSPEVPPDGVGSPPVRRAVELHRVQTGRATAPGREPPAVPHPEPAPGFARALLDDRHHQRLLTGTAISGIGVVDVLLGLEVALALSAVGLIAWACPRFHRAPR